MTAAVVLTCVMVMTAAAADHARKSDPTPTYWHPWFEIGGYHNSREDDGTGSFGTSRGETTIFAPITGNHRSLVFGQLTAKFFEDAAKEGNLALGYRRMMPSGFNLGAWIGTDVRRTEIDNTFWQLSGGFEALSENIDVRVNWYGPITKPQTGVAGFAQVQLQGSQISIIGSEEVGLRGVDGEIGFRLPTEFAKLDPKIFELRAYAGGYYFDHADAIDEVAGVKGRIELRVNDVIPSLPGSRLTAEYEVTHDDVRDTRHEVGMRIRIPLSGGRPTRSLASLTGQQRRMLDGVERDTDIITVRSKAEPVEDALTGTDFDRVAYASPTSDVTTTSNAAGGNSLIILNGTVVGGQTLQANQTLQGGGSTISVRGRRSGLVLPFTAPGSAGRLTMPGATDNLTLLGSNTHVSGITVVGVGVGGSLENDGIELNDDKSNMFISNVVVTDVGDNGIDADDDNTLTILNSTVARTGNDAFEFDNRNVITIVGGFADQASDEGVDGENGNSVSISGLVVSNSGDNGMSFGARNSVSVTDTSISMSGEDGISLGFGNTLVVDRVTINGAGDDGIEAIRANTLTISNLTVIGADFGIFLDDVVNPINANVATISNSSFSNIGRDVFLIEDNNTLSLSNSVINGAGADVFFIGPDVTLLVSGNTFNGSIGDDLFDIFGTNTFLSGSNGNVNNATITAPGRICNLVGGASFTGTISFVDGTVLTSGVAPCN